MLPFIRLRGTTVPSLPAGVGNFLPCVVGAISPKGGVLHHWGAESTHPLPPSGLISNSDGMQISSVPLKEWSVRGGEWWCSAFLGKESCSFLLSPPAYREVACSPDAWGLDATALILRTAGKLEESKPHHKAGLLLCYFAATVERFCHKLATFCDPFLWSWAHNGDRLLDTCAGGQSLLSLFCLSVVMEVVGKRSFRGEKKKRT